MRVFAIGLVASIVVSAGGARADDFMTECLVTADQKTCECIYRNLPADKRAAAISGLRKSNAAVKPSGNLLDPATLTQEEMQGLDAVVLAQASCM